MDLFVLSCQTSCNQLFFCSFVVRGIMEAEFTSCLVACNNLRGLSLSHTKNVLLKEKVIGNLNK